MLIPVMYLNGKHDLVKDFMLSNLIDSQGIVKFKRSNGWVSIDSGSIRRTGSTGSTALYNGEERRQYESTAAEPLVIF